MACAKITKNLVYSY